MIKQISAATMMPAGRAVVIAFVVCAGWSVSSANAQGLIWSLPEDGTWVRYEGTYQQLEIRPSAIEGNLTINWIRHLTLKSVGEEMAPYNGSEAVPCRWIEIRIVTGRSVEGQLDPGPIGVRIYKVLIPESRVIGKLVDGKSIDKDTIPVSFIPIVKGYRKTGTDPAVELKAKVLQVYPTISLLRHYKTFQADSNQPEDPQVGVGAVTATKYKGKHELESPITHAIHETELWRSDEVPFGLARWKVKIDREKKANSEPRSAFKTVTTITVDMKAQETGTEAKTELAVP